MVNRYGDRLGDAFGFAAWLHREQSRKRSIEEHPSVDVPYLTHLLDVTSLAVGAGADEDQMIAALLHDAFEDQPITPDGLDTRREIESRFGARVVSLIDAGTDTTDDPDAARDATTWRERKKHHMRELFRRAEDDPAVVLVPLADKAANCRSILDDLQADGRLVWRRFNASPASVVWYYDAMLEVLAVFLGGSPLVDRLARDVQILRALAVVEELRRLTVDAIEGRHPTDLQSDADFAARHSTDQAAIAAMAQIRLIMSEVSGALRAGLASLLLDLETSTHAYAGSMEVPDEDAPIGWEPVPETSPDLALLLPEFDAGNRCQQAAEGLRDLVGGRSTGIDSAALRTS